MPTADGKYGVAVWGAGWVAGEHAKAYMANPECEVVAVGSRTAEGARAKAAEWGVKRAFITTNLDDILGRQDVDIVSICSPNYRHASETIKCAQAGKHICIEKPVAITPEDLMEMRSAVRKAGVKTIVCFELHFNPLFMFAHECVENGLIGQPFYVETDYLSRLDYWWSGWHWARTKDKGGSTWMNAGCHAVDALRQFGGDVAEVSAYATAGYRHDMEWIPTYTVIAQFQNGAIGRVGTSSETVMPYTFNLCIYGPHGSLRNDMLYSNRLPGLTGMMKVPTVVPDTAEVTHHPFKGQMNHFVDCIRGGKETIVNLEDAYKTFDVIFAIEQSALEKRPVKLPFLA